MLVFEEGLGAEKDISPVEMRKNEELFVEQFEAPKDRRLCFFFNEMEDALEDYFMF